MPRWLKLVTDQSMTYGEKDLHYKMGDPVNYKNEQMSVKVDFGDLWFSSYYTEKDNSISVVNSRLETWSVGTWNIVLDTSYRDSNGTLVEFTKVIVLTIREIGEDDNEPEFVAPEIFVPDFEGQTNPGIEI